ncbi:MAG: vWA domain-containing protein [Roseibacillus sp.]
MAKLIVPQEGEAELGVTGSETVKLALQRQRQRDTIQSIISSLIVVALITAVLALIAIVSWRMKSPTIVTYQAPAPEIEPVDRPEVNQRARPNPPGQKSSRAKVIASSAPSPISVPIPENPVPEGPFGMSDEIGEGWGDNEGDGTGGGGASFFGSYRKGRRVAYVVDFSGSMGSTAEGGGTFASHLKDELAKSIEGLGKGMSFSVIFFSSRAWDIATEGPDYVGNGWNGLGNTPPCNWYPATEHIKKQVIGQVRSMPSDGGTSWYPGLKMALSMNPPPSIVYLLSDGEPRDGENVLFNLKELNPMGTPIDTIAFELPGTPAGLLLEISQNTGGRFSMVYKGELKTGRAAEALTNPKFD